MNEPTMGVGLLGDSSVRGIVGTIADVVLRPVRGKSVMTEFKLIGAELVSMLVATPAVATQSW
jgi:hypothetical protein